MENPVGKQFLESEKTRDLVDRLTEHLKDYQSDIDGVKPPQSQLAQTYDELVQSVESHRGRGLFYPYLSSGMGNGVFVELGDGSVKYDFIIGIGVHYLGHSDPKLTRAVLEASLQDTVMQGNLQQNEDSVHLMEDFLRVANRDGADLDHCFLTSSGAMANENGLKILFHHRPEARRILAFEGCFSGRSLALAQVTDKPGYREGLPETIPVDYVPFIGKHRPPGKKQEALDQLRELLSENADEYGCMMMELVQGEGGFYPADREVLIEALEILDEHGVPVLVDEIQTFGRTTQPFSFQHFGIDEYVDVVTVGKLSQTCATLYRQELNPDPGLISQTFTSSSTAIRASRHIIDHLINNDYFGENGRIQRIHEWATEELRAIQSRHPNLVDGPFGIGSMVAFEVLDGSRDRTLDFLHQLYENGVIGFLAGEDPSRVRFLLPAGCITREQIGDAFDIVEETLLNMQNNT